MAKPATYVAKSSATPLSATADELIILLFLRLLTVDVLHNRLRVFPTLPEVDADMTTHSTRLPPMHASSAARNSVAGRIDALPASAGLWRFITLLALGGFFELYDLFETGYISTGLLAAGVFHTGEAGVLGFSDQAAFASATFLGLFFGASLLAPYADRFGRRLTFMCALLWYGLFSLLMAFQQSAEMIILFRFLVGIGLGVELVTIDTYLSEWVPSHLRSRAFAYAFSCSFYRCLPSR